jgi:hypothetical protein
MKSPFFIYAFRSSVLPDLHVLYGAVHQFAHKDNADIQNQQTEQGDKPDFQIKIHFPSDFPQQYSLN